MRSLRRIPFLILVSTLPWVWCAMAAPPKPRPPKRETKGARESNNEQADLGRLNETERRAVLLGRFSEQQRRLEDERLKAERAAAQRSISALQTALKSAMSDDDCAELNFQIGAAHVAARQSTQATASFRQAMELDPSGEWGASARLRLFDLFLYEGNDLNAARDLLVGISSDSAKKLEICDRQALIATLESGDGWVPGYPAIRDESSDATWLLRLGDLRFAAGDHQQALELFDAVAGTRKLHPTRREKSYANFRRAEATYQLNAAQRPCARSFRDAIGDYLLAQKCDKDAPWVGDALFLAGNIHWNQFQDDAAAIKLWTKVGESYRDCHYAENASFTIGVLYQLYGDIKKAKAAFADFRRRYPDSLQLGTLNSDGLAAHIQPIKRPQ